MKRLFAIGVSVAAAGSLLIGCQDRDRSVTDDYDQEETARTEESYNRGQAAPGDTRSMARAEGEQNRPIGSETDRYGQEQAMGSEQEARPLGEEEAPVAGSEMAQANEQEARGTVQAVDAQAGTLTLQTEAGESLTLREEGEQAQTGEPAQGEMAQTGEPAEGEMAQGSTSSASLEDVRPGQMVSVTYETREGTNWVREIHQDQGEAAVPTEDPAAQDPSAQPESEQPQE